MNTFTNILLVVIFVLLISDVFFLWKIYRGIGYRKNHLPDERYFELKYNINLLKAASAILIFLVGFLGFNSYNNISENIDKDFSEKFDKQNKRIDSLTIKLSNYESLIDSLNVEESETVETLDEINRRFKSINNKLEANKEALKYTTKVYVVDNLKINFNNREQIFRFKNMTTINKERLPKFQKKPMITLQGKSAVFDILEITKEYIKLDLMTYSPNDNNFELFEMWIAEPN